MNQTHQPSLNTFKDEKLNKRGQNNNQDKITSFNRRNYSLQQINRDKAPCTNASYCDNNMTTSNYKSDGDIFTIFSSSGDEDDDSDSYFHQDNISCSQEMLVSFPDRSNSSGLGAMKDDFNRTVEHHVNICCDENSFPASASTLRPNPLSLDDVKAIVTSCSSDPASSSDASSSVSSSRYGSHHHQQLNISSSYLTRTPSEETHCIQNSHGEQRLNQDHRMLLIPDTSRNMFLSEQQMQFWADHTNRTIDRSLHSFQDPSVQEDSCEYSHSRGNSTVDSILTYSEDDTDDSLKWNEDLAMNQRVQSVTRLSEINPDLSPYGHLQFRRTEENRPFLSSSNFLERERDPHEPIPCKPSSNEYIVYRERWLMLFYISMLNLLSDWTGYSIAPISILVVEKYKTIDPNLLVTVFLVSSAVGTIFEPIILVRVGLRRTILFGAFLLMAGNMVKSGGISENKQGVWGIFTGFFLVGLSQPLYQCTPALLSASWFPENERTLATSLALNANQLGIGFAFVFGTLLVGSSDGIPSYFMLLSVLSTLAFIGCIFQFQDSPSTPPSRTARVMTNGLSRHRSRMKPAGDNISCSDQMNKRQTYDGISQRHGAISRKSVQDNFSQDVECRNFSSLNTYTRIRSDLNNDATFVSDIDIDSCHNYEVRFVENLPTSYHDSWNSKQNNRKSIGDSVLPSTNDDYCYHKREDRHDIDYNSPMKSQNNCFEPVSMSTRNRTHGSEDEQIISSVRSCFSRPGFSHSVVAFSVSSVVVNVLSTYMDYLVRFDGTGRFHVGLIGGLFQVLILMSGIILGKITDRTRAYYSTIIVLLVLGAFALAECGINLDREDGSDLKWSLLIVAVFVGPLQPIATELGVDVAFPVCENTVLVTQQLFANCFSALFIPLFSAVSDVGRQVSADSFGRPAYMFSFFLLIFLHAVGTVFFATFEGKYLRLEHEIERKNIK